MKKYRIRYYHEKTLQESIYMPQIKVWWGWSNLFELANTNLSYKATRTEESARSYIKTHIAMSLRTIENKVSVVKNATRIIDVE